jgi:hypothetical protein
MTAIRFDPTIDLEVCEAMAEEFEDYLASDVLYWQMSPAHSGSHAWPKLTIGGGLERMCRLQAYVDHLTPEQRVRLERTRRRLDTVRDAHMVHYVAKANRELQSRLDAWQWFLDDFANRPGELAVYYPSEVRDRLKIALLVDVLQGEPGLEDKTRRLQALDNRLRADFAPGEFVWDAALAGVLPPEPYWWLYGGLRATREGV